MTKMTWVQLLKSLLVALAASAAGSVTAGEFTLAPPFADHMVLQRDMRVPIWGRAGDGQVVTVEFDGQTKTATATTNGVWRLELEPLKASAISAELVASSDGNRIVVRDVMVGEVWVCSGQSNMEKALGSCLGGKEDVAASEDLGLRLMLTRTVPGQTVATAPPLAWKPCTRDVSGRFSGVGYYFARKLRRELGVPVGMIWGSVGGSLAHSWTPPNGANFNASIARVVPYGIRGAIWYQGEADVGRGLGYQTEMVRLITGWRQTWQQGEFPFLFVQLPNYAGSPEKPVRWEWLREAQRRSLSIPHTGMAVTIDVGQSRALHPANKADVGERLAAWALHYQYGREDVMPSGPLYKGHEIRNGRVIVRFDHVGRGLMTGTKKEREPVTETTEATPQAFEVADSAGQWHAAEARVAGDTVEVWTEAVKEPVAIRYAFAADPAAANLYNRDGLPAAPFTSKQKPTPGKDR